MAEIVLRLVAEKGNVEKTFEEAAKAPKKLSQESKKATESIAKDFKKLGETIEKTPKIPAPITPKEKTLLKEYKDEYNKYLKEAAAAQKRGDTAGFNAALKNAAAAKAEIGDLQDAIKTLDPDVKAQAFTNLASSAVGGLQGIAGAFAVVGGESEEYQKILLRLQAIDAIGNGIRAVGQLKDQWGVARIALEEYIGKAQLKATASAVEDQAATVESLSNAVESATEVQAANTSEVGKAGIAQRALSAITSMGVGAYIAIGVAIGAAIIAIVEYITSSNAAKEAEKIRSKAIDGTIIKNAELRKSYNDLMIQQKKYAIDLKVVNGQMTKFSGEVAKAAIEKTEKIRAANQEWAASVKESESALNTFTTNLTAAFTAFSKEEVALGKSAEAHKKRAETIAAAQIEEAAAVKAQQAQLAQAEAESGQELLIERLKTREALLSAAGRNTISIQKQIINEEAALEKQRVGNTEQSANQIAVIEEQRQQRIIALDSQEAKTRADIARESAAERRRIAAQLMSELIALEENVSKQGEQNKTPEQRAKEQLETNLKALEGLRNKAIDNSKKLSDEEKRSVESGLNKIRDEAYQKYYDEIARIAIENQKATFAQRLKYLDDAQAIELNRVELFEKEKGESQQSFEKRQQQAKQAIQLSFAEKRLEFLKANGTEENAVEVSNLEALIANLKRTIETEKGKVEKFSISKFIQSALGLNDDEFAAVEDAARQLFDSVGDIFEEGFQARENELDRLRELNDAEIDENQRKIDELNAQLEDQLQQQANGYANNVDSIRDALAQENQERIKNLNEQRKIEAEKAKIARQRILAESVSQASSLATSGANIFAALSPLGPVGVALAIATIGTMLGAFTLSKANAIKAAKQGYKKGGFTGNGNPNDEAGVVHKNEFVHTAEKTNKYRSLFEGIHKDQLSAKDVLPLLSDYGLMNFEQPKNAKTIIISDNEGVEDRLDKIITMNKSKANNSRVIKRRI